MSAMNGVPGGVCSSSNEISEVSGHFYRNQCKILEEQLSIAEEILKKERAPGGVSSTELFWPPSALSELRRVVEVGRGLIDSCQEEHILKAYLRQDERTAAFAEVLTEISWCTSVVFYYASQRCNLPGKASMAVDEFPQAKLGAKEQYLLQRAVFDDQAELQQSLVIWIPSHSCCAEECGRPSTRQCYQVEDPQVMCLGAQILARLQSNNDGGIIADAEAHHTSVLWKTTQAALTDIRQIGRGAFASIIKTSWLGETYAKKEFYLIPKSFEDEANALAKLNHPHIVKIIAYSEEHNLGDEASCFFLMESMPCDLRKHMERKLKINPGSPPFSIFAALDSMLQLSEAMHYIHSQEMVHRDLKPENILVQPVTSDGELSKEGFVIVKLADFGLAKSKHEVTAYSHATHDQGTRLWMAPEMFSANEDDEHLLVAFPRKADVYSFGIVCSEILTGMVPFHHVNFRRGYLYKLLTDRGNPLRPELPESCPESLAFLIRQCWDSNPLTRPTSQKSHARSDISKALS